MYKTFIIFSFFLFLFFLSLSLSLSPDVFKTLFVLSRCHFGDCCFVCGCLYSLLFVPVEIVSIYVASYIVEKGISMPFLVNFCC